jgi:cbb3-type cytochrome oxidase subunit 3
MLLIIGSNNFISSRLGTIIGAVLSFIGIIFMVLIIYGGLLWMLAKGNESQVDKS